MSTLIGKFFADKADQSADQTLAYTFMASAAGGASAYLAATLQATTPELRAMLSGMLSQKIVEHESMNALMMKKGWMNPYDEPIKQLYVCEMESQSVLSQHS